MDAKTSRRTFRERFDHMVETIRNEIYSDKYADGDYLPSEMTIAERFNLSRNSVRKGLDILVEEGLIEKRPRIGNVVIKTAPKEQQVIRFGYYPTLLNEADILTLVAKFEKHYTGLKVIPIALPFEQYHDTVREYIRNGLLDVFCINHTDFLRFKEAGELDTLFLPLDRREEIYPFLNDHFSVEKRLYVQSLIFSPVILCYNLQHLAECGLSEPDSGWTWFDFEQATAKLNKDDRGGFYTHLLSINRWPVFWLQALAQDGTTEEKLVQSLLYSYDLIYNSGTFSSCLTENDADAEQLFLQEKVSMIMTTYFGLNIIKDAPFEYDVASLPHFGKARTLVLNIGTAISAETGNEAGSRLFIEYLASEEAQTHIRQRTLSIPSRKSIAEARDIAMENQPSRYSLYRDIIPTFVSFADFGYDQKEIKRLRSKLRLLWAKMISPEEFSSRLKQLKRE